MNPQQPTISRNRIIVGLVAVVVIIFAGLFWNDLRKARLTIITEEGAEILVTDDRTAPPELIGTTQATFKTGSTDRVYVLVQKDGRVTQGVYELDSGERREVTLGLDTTQTAQPIVETPLSKILLGRNYAFGIDPLDQSMSYGFRGSTTAAPRVDFSALPRIADITWVDANNFVYDGFGSGVSFFVNGSDRRLDEGVETEGVLTQLYQDYATDNPRERILMLRDGELYLSRGISDTEPRVVGSVTSTGDTQVYSVRDKAVLITPVYENIITDSEEEGQSEFAAVAYEFVIVGYDGKIQQEFALDTSDIVEEVVAFGEDDYAILTDKDVYIVDGANGETRQLPLFFEQARDIATLGNDIVLLNSEGLWRYKTESETLHLMSSYNDDEVYSPKSLQVRGSDILYSASVIEEVKEFTDPENQIDFTGASEQARANGYVYQIKL